MIVTSCLHFIWCEILVVRMGLEVFGVSIATIITYFLNFAAITAFCVYDKEVRRSFFWFTKESFTDLRSYLRVGIPSTTMLCLEWWSFEVLAFMAGYVSVEALSAHVVVLNTHTLLIMVPLGAQVAATVLVGQAMGEGNHKKAN
jgi:MATE family multidrug resistance protein